MEKKILTASLRSAMFGDRGGDVIAALEYAHQCIEAMPESSSRAPAFTALHVVCNTIANAIDALELPADHPAAGVTDLEASIIRLIDQRVAQSPVAATRALIDERINHWAEDQFDSRVKTWVDEEMSSWLGNHAEAIDLESQIDHYMTNSFDMTELIRDELKQNITFSIEVD